jgi:hypothetical protein
VLKASPPVPKNIGQQIFSGTRIATIFSKIITLTLPNHLKFSLFHFCPCRSAAPDILLPDRSTDGSRINDHPAAGCPATSPTSPPVASNGKLAVVIVVRRQAGEGV